MTQYHCLRNILLLFYVFIVSVRAGTFENFSKVNLSHEFVDVLSKLEIELDSGGGRIVELPNGSVWVVGVGITTNKDFIKQRQVADSKARKAVLETLRGEFLNSKSVQTLDAKVKVINGVETGESTEDFNQRIERTVSDFIIGLKPAGTWYSQDGELFYLAVCNRLK